MADWNKKSTNESWKSSVNRFCKYCKCWVADNKASWAGHEQGSRHKKAVEDKLMEMKRNAVMTQKHGQVGVGIMAHGTDVLTFQIAPCLQWLRWFVVVVWVEVLVH